MGCGDGTWGHEGGVGKASLSFLADLASLALKLLVQLEQVLAGVFQFFAQMARVWVRRVRQAQPSVVGRRLD